MDEIWQSKNFVAEVPKQPLVTRTDGGHIVINPKKWIHDRTQLSPSLAKELMYLTMLIGEAMTKGLIERGIDIGRINYQDNGNWSVFKPGGPCLHYHLYGRARNAVVQKFGEACYFPFPETGFYKDVEPLNAEDINVIQKHIHELRKEKKYDEVNWEIEN